ncbi:gamma-adducin-like [Sinocyclocheilus grahami]|uniref:gamma-adducin-like n=1 Tax=Sinocyclocheilus grahami TaxID=75366 RepID=UPI0007AC6705|nr:PREDICTED: gamma-adducin-like [Sinocyclocheilus grahami]
MKDRSEESFREELDVLIQEQMNKGGSSSNLWALRQIADFMATHGSPASLPVSQSTVSMVTPINDLHGWDPGSMVKGERLMRCKLASVHRLLDLYGWTQLPNTCLTVRNAFGQHAKTHALQVIVHRLLDLYGWTQLPNTCLTVRNAFGQHAKTHALQVKVNILGEVVEKGSTALGVDLSAFALHSAVYSARPDIRCLLHLHTPATAAVSAMKCGLLLLSHEALLVGDVAYYDYNGVMEEEEDRVELQKSLGPTCKVLVLRNHGIVALGESVEEAFYTIYHIQTACQIQVAALCSAGGEQNLIMLDRSVHRPVATGTVGWAGSTFGPMHKSRLGEHEFEALMRTLDNLWQKAEEIMQGSGWAIKIENPNQFVPLFTNPQEVLETRNKIREQNRQDMKTAGPRSQVLASVITDNSPPTPEAVGPPSAPEPETPNPFNKLTDRELEEYREEVQRKQDGVEEVVNDTGASPTKTPLSEAVQNDKGDEKKQQEELEKQMKALSTTDTPSAPPPTPPTAPPNKPAGHTPEVSPSKSPSKKKKKFKAPCFLKKSKKQKEKAES